MQARNAELCRVEGGRGGQLSQELLTCLPRSRGAWPPRPHLDLAAHHPSAARFLTESHGGLALGLQENLVFRGVLAMGSSIPHAPCALPTPLLVQQHSVLLPGVDTPRHRSQDAWCLPSPTSYWLVTSDRTLNSPDLSILPCDTGRTAAPSGRHKEWMNSHTSTCQLVLFGCQVQTLSTPAPQQRPAHAWGSGPGSLHPASGPGLGAVAAGWPRGAAWLTADLQGRVLAPGHLAGAEGHGRVKLGLEQLQLLQCL